MAVVVDYAHCPIQDVDFVGLLNEIVGIVEAVIGAVLQHLTHLHLAFVL